MSWVDPRSKNLACRIIQRSKAADNVKVTFHDGLKPKNLDPEDPIEYDNPWDDLYAARPVVLRKQIIDYNHGQGRPQYTEEGREYTRQELQNITVDFQQKDMTDVDLLAVVWDKRTNTFLKDQK